MGVVIGLIKWILLIIGAISVYYGAMLQFKYNGVTGKIINEIFSPTLHPQAMEKVYMPMANRLLDSGDITMASIRRIALGDDVSIEDAEEAMSSIATERSIREVGVLPLSEQVEIQLKEAGDPNFKQRYLKIFQYCSPRTAMEMVDYSDAFSAYLPCRVALIEDKQGKHWLYTLDMDPMIYGGKPLPPALHKKALQVQKTIYAIQDGGAAGDF